MRGGVLQQALDDAVSLDEDAGSAVDDLVLEPILLDVGDDSLVFGPRLEP